MKWTSTRRQFLKTSAFAGASILLGSGKTPAWAYARNEKLNIGVIGVAGRGGENLRGVAATGNNIAALCDIDENNLYEASKHFPAAKLYSDFRKLLEQKDLDAAVVSTPDHTHAVASVAAMKAGLHVYCEKPLAHDVYEAHVVAATSVQHRRATQMGTQIHAGGNYRRVVELIQIGAIGAVKEVHVWVGKAWSGGESPDRPKETPEVPSTIHYDLWLGPAPERPYHPAYLPFHWRRWWDFGGGTLADMGCHHMDLAHWALNLWCPESVEAEGPPVHPETAPAWLIVRYHHPARGKLPPITVTWYDGGKRPPHFAEGKLPKWEGDGSLFVGEKGMLIADYGTHKLLPEEQYKDFKPPAPYIPDSLGHYEEWIQSCRTGCPTTCNFRYGGALTECVLLGIVAYRSGKKIEWDAPALKAANAPEANQFLRREYRKGWSL
ncbi:MAG: Gfo/Idh/MocA family oxidoreductase [Planctomycetes bacterium]|nr:Gfo/Idh/MocA family oxidoreductase [Planctomycetota bacterium]